MLSYYSLKSRKKTEKKSKSCKDKKSKNNAFIKCVVCDSKKSKFIKEQEASGLLSSLRMKTPLSKIYLTGPSFVSIVLNKLTQGIKCMK